MYSDPDLSDAEEEDILESKPIQTEEDAQIHHGLHTVGGVVPYFDASPNQNRVENETLMISEQTKETHMKDGLVGTKHVHISESSDSDKDHPQSHPSVRWLCLQLAPIWGIGSRSRKRKERRGRSVISTLLDLSHRTIFFCFSLLCLCFSSGPFWPFSNML